ncbi:hypothetical protein MTO96_005568 [Rhipicephalus appendiculatus]
MNELKKFQSDLSGSQTGVVSVSELVLGIRFADYLDEAEVAHHPHLPITILVVQTHIDRRVGSVPVIGTLVGKLEGPRGKSVNMPTLTNAISSLKAANITASVSPHGPPATGKRRRGPWMVFKRHARTTRLLMLLETEFCDTKGIKGTEVFCFEDSSTITEKVKRVNLDYKIMRSWAVFDTEFEDYKNVCGKGTFQRISQLKKYLQDTFLADCQPPKWTMV